MVGNALPGSGRAAVSGPMRLRRSPVLPPFVVHVKPVRVPQPDYGATPRRRGGAGPSSRGATIASIPQRAATTLELTSAEARVAVWLAEGKSVRGIAEATGQSSGGIY